MKKAEEIHNIIAGQFITKYKEIKNNTNVLFEDKSPTGTSSYLSLYLMFCGTDDRHNEP
jgi:hypothetical protein